MMEELKACSEALKAILEKHGEEIFCMAVEEVANNHPELQSSNQLLRWELLLLPKNCDYDEILEVAEKSAIANSREELEQLI